MNSLRAAAAVAATAVSLSLAAPVAAYPVDCAILLCLAGGWPASAECAHARAVFIARITPWPVEPPLRFAQLTYGPDGVLAFPRHDDRAAATVYADALAAAIMCGFVLRGQ